jgi:hypothetical protein
MGPQHKPLEGVAEALKREPRGSQKVPEFTSVYSLFRGSKHLEVATLVDGAILPAGAFVDRSR